MFKEFVGGLKGQRVGKELHTLIQAYTEQKSSAEQYSWHEVSKSCYGRGMVWQTWNMIFGIRLKPCSVSVQ